MKKQTYIVYAIKSDRDGRIYVGLTANLEQRIRYHNSGLVFSTKGYRPWRLFHKESFETRAEARIREKKLKSGYGKEYLKSIPR
ncbi:MAG: endonuclease [Candidatus Doudnabacteria bacterium RIFCSPHIGHO2_01_52_17]|uniref:Endonuclease n=1 Tax=Candidatus Doudnabacteria bacterium RIFCSPHIGHO2_01_52_17 TaxID=1817820 RepID=A0A1F5ND61_9BACT|nr:MAG: endonuclease [Candidatus Doudnabacteria bacterium RIFCSPHIGHO2_01_52_17]